MKSLFTTFLLLITVTVSFACNTNQTVSFSKPTFGCIFTPTVLVNTSTRTAGWFWTWDFGDGQNDYTANTQHTFMVPGNYVVTLTGDSGGCAHVEYSDTLVVGSCGVGAACQPELAYSIITPDPWFLPCIRKGLQYDTVLTWKTPDRFEIQFGSGKTAIDSMRIDSIFNLPCGINYIVNNHPNNVFLPNEIGCIRLSGITNDSVGEYTLAFVITVWFPNGVVSRYSTPVNAYPQAIEYYVKLTDSLCDALPTKRMSSCNPLQPLLIRYTQDTIRYCVGQGELISVASYGGGGQHKYHWSPSVGLSCTDCKVPYANGGSQQYLLTVTDAVGDTLTKTFVVLVDTIDPVEIISDPSPPCTFQNIKFHDNEPNGMGFRYWYINGAYTRLVIDSVYSTGVNDAGSIIYMIYEHSTCMNAPMPPFYSNPVM